MSYYKACPFCGAHLDPGENCNCVEAIYERLTPENKRIVKSTADKLLAEQKEAAVNATNIDNGKAEQIDKPVSASIVIENKEDCKR